jgi:hypothetical protein
MSVVSQILFILTWVNMLISFIFLIIIRKILIKLGERESYIMVTPISDLFLLKKISKDQNGKYNRNIIQSVCVYSLQIILIFLMILLM